MNREFIDVIAALFWAAVLISFGVGATWLNYQRWKAERRARRRGLHQPFIAIGDKRGRVRRFDVDHVQAVTYTIRVARDVNEAAQRREQERQEAAHRIKARPKVSAESVAEVRHA